MLVRPPGRHRPHNGERGIGRAAATLAGLRLPDAHLRVLTAAPMDRQDDLARRLVGVSRNRIRRLIDDGVLPAKKVVPYAPFQIRTDDLQHERVATAIGRTGRPCRVDHENQL
jgi:hypothetical protein